MPTISVVIATYNRASLLEATLAQLRLQAYEPGDEVIIVDNGSTDGTAGVIARAADEFPVPLRQLRELRPGKTPALNAGTSVARGDILALTDDDVVVADDWIGAIRRIFSDHAVALVGGRVDPRWERPAPRWLRVEDEEAYGPMASPLALLHYGPPQDLGERTAVGANLIVRRSVHDAVGGFAPHLGRRRGTLLCGEDHEFCQRLVAAGYRCEYRPEVRVRHWVPASRTTLRYYLRWFFWSGLTNAVLESSSVPGATGRGTVPPYVVRQLLAAGAAATWDAVRLRVPAATARVMDAAFALGYIAHRLTGRPRSGIVQQMAGVNG